VQAAGCAVLDCPAINYSLVQTNAVKADVSKRITPQETSKYLSLLNMDAHAALELLANLQHAGKGFTFLKA
jgi:hypothetical protein